MVLICLLAFCFIGSTQAAIDKLVVFGDSLSDNGNLYRFTGRAHYINLTAQLPASPPYFKGRFSNGPVWAELLAKRLGLTGSQFQDYAYGGSWVEDQGQSGQYFPPSLFWQITDYLTSNPLELDLSRHLFIVWHGSNVYLATREDPEKATDSTVTAIEDQLERLIGYGAKHFLLPNLPDLGITPLARQSGPQYAAALTQLATLHNQKLAKMVTRITKRHPYVDLITVDVFAKLHDAVDHPEKYQLTNVSQACYGGAYVLPQSAMARQQTAAAAPELSISNNPSLLAAAYTAQLHQMAVLPCSVAEQDHYLFWDSIHPTAKTHRIIAKQAAKLVS